MRLPYVYHTHAICLLSAEQADSDYLLDAFWALKIGHIRNKQPVGGITI